MNDIWRIISMNNERIYEIIAEQLNVDREGLTEETVLTDELGADSLDLFQIIMALEEEYSIEIPTEDAEGIHSIGDIVTYLSTIV